MNGGARADIREEVVLRMQQEIARQGDKLRMSKAGLKEGLVTRETVERDVEILRGLKRDYYERVIGLGQYILLYVMHHTPRHC